MRTWTKQSGEGKLFSVDLLDAEGGQIRATMFNEAADRLYPIFQQDKVYVISKGQLKLANKKFSRVPNEYELTLNNDAEVTFFGDDTAIQSQAFSFTSIQRITEIEKDEFIDVIGIVKTVSPLATIITKAKQNELKKRDVQLLDQSLSSVNVTFWGEQAEQYNETELSNNVVIAIKGAKVGDFGGRTLSSGFNSQIFVNPDIKETKELKHWYESKGANASVVSISENRTGGNAGGGNEPRKYFADIKLENLGHKDKPDFFSVRGTITFFTHDPEKPPWYNACPVPKCNKKVSLDESTNQWYCDKCSISQATCDPRYILRFLACDGTGSEWLTAFNEMAIPIMLGKKASELNELKDDNRLAFEAAFQEANFRQYIFKVRAKAETVQDAVQVKCSVVKVDPIDFRAESRSLLAEIAAYN
jgi:replication factor A1